jgi:uncharacterized protein YggE
MSPPTTTHVAAHDDPLRLQPARLAAAAGHRTARAYAEGIGARLGPVIRLTEPEHSRSSGPQRVQALAAASADGMHIDAGQQEVTARIDPCGADADFSFEPATIRSSSRDLVAGPAA